MSNTGKPVDMSSLLNDIVKRKNWQRRIGQHKVFSFWHEIVGDEIAARSKPFIIRGSVLWVNVSDSALMQQLHLRQVVLLELINRRLSLEKITEIRFRLDSSLGCSKKTQRIALKSDNCDSEKLREFEVMVSSIKDDQLREIMTRLWRKFHQTRDG